MKRDAADVGCFPPVVVQCAVRRRAHLDTGEWRLYACPCSGERGALDALAQAVTPVETGSGQSWSGEPDGLGHVPGNLSTHSRISLCSRRRQIINDCYLTDYVGYCSSSAAEQPSMVVGFALSLLAVVGITFACVALALKLKGREPHPPLGNVWLALVRLVLASIGALVSAIGITLLGTGLFVLITAWLYYSSHPDLGFAGITYFIGFTGSIAGAVATSVGALVLWLAGLRRRATMSTQST